MFSSMETLNTVLQDYQKNGVRVSVEIPEKDLLKLFAFAVGTAICVILAVQLIKGIFTK